VKRILTLALAQLAMAACAGSTTTQPADPASKSPAYTLRVAQSALGSILTDAQGRTLYYYKLDSGGKIACVGQCVMNWAPLLDSTRPTAPSSLTGELATGVRPDGGSQVLFNDRPLYTFAGDKKPGETNGQGVDGSWFVATPSLSDADAAGEQPSPTAIPAVAPPSVPASTPAPARPAATARPSFNDGDADNNGGASDGDGNG
jgi:predicted lipoprotein with Yx(FWY)xxD motif